MIWTLVLHLEKPQRTTQPAQKMNENLPPGIKHSILYRQVFARRKNITV